ncbi:hypothetical protein INP83_11560 [Mucilaginibacter sp. 21P]|uniref:hypothetical protein n=1 Tax=Mucilaginibacter sp. 21P TaxID=2778902 RepID=UPI001C56526B|nr:hypothetical protein [Mucilaginibacter sp. 21P]QXV63744.1 hypothetical protein INP83_11560 [Mucilaginibacter sp. 21P]
MQNSKIKLPEKKANIRFTFKAGMPLIATSTRSQGDPTNTCTTILTTTHFM